MTTSKRWYLKIGRWRNSVWTMHFVLDIAIYFRATQDVKIKDSSTRSCFVPATLFLCCKKIIYIYKRFRIRLHWKVFRKNREIMPLHAKLNDIPCSWYHNLSPGRSRGTEIKIRAVISRSKIPSINGSFVWDNASRNAGDSTRIQLPRGRNRGGIWERRQNVRKSPREIDICEMICESYKFSPGVRGVFNPGLTRRVPRAVCGEICPPLAER